MIVLQELNYWLRRTHCRINYPLQTQTVRSAFALLPACVVYRFSQCFFHTIFSTSSSFSRVLSTFLSSFLVTCSRTNILKVVRAWTRSRRTTVASSVRPLARTWTYLQGIRIKDVQVQVQIHNKLARSLRFYSTKSTTSRRCSRVTFIVSLIPDIRAID